MLELILKGTDLFMKKLEVQTSFTYAEMQKECYF